MKLTTSCRPTSSQPKSSTEDAISHIKPSTSYAQKAR
nr:MAG TPA: hypothetical protein [Caudoviricetes sp.]